MDWHERLARALKAKNWSVADLAREMGSAGDDAVLNRLYKYTSGEVRNPRGDWMARMAAALGETEQYLRYGVHEGSSHARLLRPAGPEKSEVEFVSEGYPDTGDEWMDLRGVVEGGADGGFEFGNVIDQVRRPPGLRKAKHVAALNVAGESMAPRFMPGELIYVHQRLAVPGDDVVVELHPETDGDAPKAFLKQFLRKTGLRIYCKQHNPASEIEFDAGEVRTVWRVVPLRELLF